MNFLKYLFNPSSIALIGAAHTCDRLGGIMLYNLKGFKGSLYPVNPKYKEIMGLKAYRSVKEIPHPVDLSIIIRPASETPAILKALKDKTKTAIIASSGFGEIGETTLQDEIMNISQELDIRILGPNCMGFINRYKDIDTFFVPFEMLASPPKGNISIVSQSGALLHCILEALKTWNAGISIAVGYGNAIDINESDIYEYLKEDQHTSLVISYIESIADGRRFIEAASSLNKKKSLIVLKSGKSLSGQFAALSHTGRLAGRYEVFHSVLRQFGIKEAENLEELIDIAKTLSFYRPVSGKRVCIVTNGGGVAVLAVDECITQGLEVNEIPANKIQRLKTTFPVYYNIKNPIDITAQGRDEDYITALKEVYEDYDGFLIIALMGVPGITNRLASLLKNFKKVMNKPLVFHTTRSPASEKLVRNITRVGIPVFASPERAVKGLRALLL
jgi:acyl-CoA synthetase (NDP forming)